jgi:hypothetical protein
MITPITKMIVKPDCVFFIHFFNITNVLRMEFLTWNYIFNHTL